MKILKDSIFKIGKAHSVCQDYAANITYPPIRNTTYNVIALSDGCSSSLNTDWGSRFIVNESLGAVWWPKNIKEIMLECQMNISYISDLDLSCLDATLLMATVGTSWDNKVSFSMKIYGDGVFAYRLKNDTVKITKVEFANNAPYYPAYEIFPERKKNYLEIFGGQKTITEYTIQDGKIINTEVKVVEYNECDEYKFIVSDLKSFFLFSDGVETFHQVVKTETSKFTKDISTVDSVLEIMNCPTFGPFLEKKYTKMSEQHAKQGIFHSDDLSVAAFLFQENL